MLSARAEGRAGKDNKMKKALSMLLALAMIFALCACGSSAPAATEAPSDISNQVIRWADVGVSAVMYAAVFLPFLAAKCYRRGEKAA